ncbi:phosphoribosylamine--glycine ligase [Cytophagaceae bacterium ABcell3]|nr:phosphoribosylamine--glycine ligase [Cytophagaceae bacterium ABcell3]
MNILIVGSGGREHTLTWKIKQSPLCKNLYVAPGNAGTALLAENVNIGVEDFSALGNFCKEKNIEMVVVGPEVPLVAGIKDYFKGKDDLKHIAIIGPDKKGAILEGSKDFSKDFMARHNIPTAASKTFTSANLEEGLQYIDNHSVPIVLKADGLAAGKGVVISETREDAKATLKDMLLESKFGNAGSKVVIEEFLNGIEISVFILSDGDNYIVLPAAKDYKRIGEGDTGPNTGGMGAVSPVPFANQQFLDKVEEKIIKPTVEGLKKEGIDYTGFIFFGLMNIKGDPYVIEYNARLGDPETEVIIPRLKNDFVEVLKAMANKTLNNIQVAFDERHASTVMLVAEGYPGDYEKGRRIQGLDKVTDKDVLVFHAGTKLSGDDVLTNGGRVISVTAYGDNMKQALEKAKATAEIIDWKGKNYRKDIGLDLLSLSAAE